jgi:molybdate transport system substrate-binding protein
MVTAGENRLTVAAASDLAFAFKELSSRYERETGTEIVISFGSTGQLTQQIENGAPFDIFFAADRRHIERLKEKGFTIPGTEKSYAQGRIVLAVNMKEGVNITKIDDLLNPSVRRIAIANPDHAPYGIAAKEALMSKGLWDKVKSKLVYGENIRQALLFIQTRNATAGIVALSVADVPEISYTPIDVKLHNPIVQAVAVLKKTRLRDEALSFIDYINGPTGRRIMKRYGFLLPGEF